MHRFWLASDPAPRQIANMTFNREQTPQCAFVDVSPFVSCSAEGSDSGVLDSRLHAASEAW